MNDTRLAPLSISSFAANVCDDSFHNVFGSFNPAVFTPTEVVINAGLSDPGGFGGTFNCFGPAVNTPNGTAITLIRGQANAPPVASCVESVNPSGKNIPRAGSKTKPGKKGPGQNEDGFYALFGQDKLGLAAPVSVRNASGSATFGPFPSGSVVKLTEARGARPTSKPMGGPNSAVAAHIRLDSDAFVYAVDSSGAQSPVVSCLVPPPPK